MSLVPLAPFLDFARNDKEVDRLDKFAVNEVLDSKRLGHNGGKLIDRYKFANARARSPAREARALPNPTNSPLMKLRICDDLMRM